MVRFFLSPAAIRVNFDDGGVQAQRLNSPLAKCLLLQMVKNFGKYAAMGPAIQPHVHGVPGPESAWQGSPFAPVAGHVGQSIEEPVVADQLAAARLGQQVTDTFELRAGDVHAGQRFSLLRHALNYLGEQALALP